MTVGRTDLVLPLVANAPFEPRPLSFTWCGLMLRRLVEEVGGLGAARSPRRGRLCRWCGGGEDAPKRVVAVGRQTGAMTDSLASQCAQ